MIKRYLMLLVILLGLSSCESTVRPSFEIMSEPELAMYNASLSIDEQVICREEIEDSQRPWNLRRGRTNRMQPKLCLSVRELKVLQRRAETAGTFGGSGYGNSIGGDYSQPADAADYHSGAFNGGHND